MDTRRYRKGLEQKKPAAAGPQQPPQGLRANSFFQEPVNRVPFGSIQGLLGQSNQHRIADLKPAIRLRTRKIDAYSAAAAKVDFGFADDTMKSEMRGTISDLNREPLNTP